MLLVMVFAVCMQQIMLGFLIQHVRVRNPVERPRLIGGDTGGSRLSSHIFTVNMSRISTASRSQLVRNSTSHSISLQNPSLQSATPTLRAGNELLSNLSNQGEIMTESIDALESYIIFRDIQYSQGIGNIITGLLAAHLLGKEFNRTVCVTKRYKEFHEAFVPTLDKSVVDECLKMELSNPPTTNNSIEILNYRPSVDECQLKSMLSSNLPVIYYTGNTYPRWPSIPDNFFHFHYRPTQILLDTLPWNRATPPKTVVHLRQGDGILDERRGLGIQTLHALGQHLPNDTFLVTNRVDWYRLFEHKYGWKHPSWSKVVHSALPSIQWGAKNKTKTSHEGFHILQAWSDWYTILNARQVYHTHSDFSASAVHWNNLWGRIILGSRLIDESNKTSELLLGDEYWIGHMNQHFADRPKSDLKGCKSAERPDPDTIRKGYTQEELNFALRMARRRQLLHPVIYDVINRDDPRQVKALAPLNSHENFSKP